MSISYSSLASPFTSSSPLTPLRSTYSYTINYTLFMSTNYFSAFEALDFVIESAGFVLPSIHFTSTILRLSYAYWRHITSIISRFSYVVPSLTRQSYSDFESVQRTSSRSIFSTFSIVALIEAPISKWTIAYNLEARTLRVTLLHLVDD